MGIKRFWIKSLALIIIAGLAAACGREADIPDEEMMLSPATQASITLTRTTICHFTGLQTLPYIAVEISDEAVANHQGHHGDLIPSPVEGCPAQADPALFQPAPAAVDPTAVAVVATTDPALPISSTATIPPTVVPTQGALCAPDGFSIQYVLNSTDNLSGFRTMLQNAGWLDALKDTRITMFAPTDQAIADMNPQLAAVLTRNPEAMNAFLLYHVLADRWDMATLGTVSSAELISGEWITIEIINNEVVFNRYVRVLTPNLDLCNGMMHIIDHVLIPPIFLSDQRPTPTAVPTYTPPPTARPTNPPLGGGDGSGNDDAPPLAPTSTPRPANTPQPTDTDVPTSPPQPTDTPTDEPTPIPTEVPTDVPTDPPTDIPTDPPTEAPIEEPTEPPTP